MAENVSLPVRGVRRGKTDIARRFSASAFYIGGSGIAAARLQYIHAATARHDNRKRDSSQEISHCGDNANSQDSHIMN